MFNQNTGRFLKDYIVADVDNLDAAEDTMLREVAEPVKFPLTDEDKEDIADMQWRFDSARDGIAGLAATQIGICKRIIVIAILPHHAKQMGCQEFVKTVWINPRYYYKSDEMEEGWEECKSVKDYVGPLKRYKTIFYSGFLEDGQPLRGRADGFAARVIQHEIDHLDGKLFVDYIPREKLLSPDQYVEMFHKPHELCETETAGLRVGVDLP